MEYKERLRAFNSTEKYKNECNFLDKLLAVDHEYGNGEAILEYGCGLGMLSDSLNADGFDVNNYNEYINDSNYFLNVLPNRVYDNIIFMHSIAHIPNPKEVLIDLKEYNATITVITPNRYWLMQQSNKDYKPDPTVVKHYTMTELKELFTEAGYEVTLCGQFGDETNGVNERIFLQAK